MTRAQKQLLGLLAVQLVLIVLLRSPFSRASGSVALKPLLPALEAFTPARIATFVRAGCRVAAPLPCS